MSVRVMSWVWEHSPEKGSALLLLLAIADFADDDGGDAYPSVETLAAKTRLGPRNVQKLLRTLEDRGRITVKFGAGRNQTNVYQVVMTAELEIPKPRPAVHPSAATTAPKPCPGGHPEHPGKPCPTGHPENFSGVNSRVEKGELGDTGGVNWETPDPSEIHQDPSDPLLRARESSDDEERGERRILEALSDSGIELTARVCDSVAAFLEDGGEAEWFLEAIQVARAAGRGRAFDYIRGITNSWLREGGPPERRQRDGRDDRTHDRHPDAAEAFAAYG